MGCMKKIKYPHSIEEGGETVVIREVRNKGRKFFRVEFYEGGVRKSKDRATEADAFACSEQVMAKLLQRKPIFEKAENATMFERAMNILGGEFELDVVAREYRLAIGKLGGVGDLLEAVDFYVAHRPEKVALKMSVLVERFLAFKKEDLAEPHYENLKLRLGIFAARKPGFLHDVKTEDFDKYLKSFGWAKRTRDNERAILITFSRWAQDNGYLSKSGKVPVAMVPKAVKKGEIGDIAIFDISTIERLLRAVEAERPDLVPYCSIALFAGVRPDGELMKLTFEKSIRWDHNDIEVLGGESKVKARRTVEMSDNLKKWLAPYRYARGFIAPAFAGKYLGKFVKKIGIEWSQDVMRHSFISYAVAKRKSVGEVALEAGNSEAVIKKHYLKMVTVKEAEKFWAIEPTMPGQLGTTKRRVRKVTFHHPNSVVTNSALAA